DKDDSPVPKVLVLVVGFDAISHTIGLPYVDSGEVLLLLADENVHTCPNELGTLADFRPFRAREDNPQSCPIHAVDQTHSLGVNIGYENAYRERVGHYRC